MKRILAFTLIFAMLFTAMLGIMPAAEESAPAKLDVAQANVQFGSTVYLLIAVDYAAAGLADGSSVKVDVTNKAGKTTTLTPDSTIFDSLKKGEQDKVPVNTYVLFKYAELSAKEMGDVLTIKAYVEGEDALTDSIEYSILEYAVKAKAAQSGSKLAKAVAAMLNFGAAAQDAFEYEGDYDLAKTWGMVLFGGVAAENKKVFAEVGTPVTAPAADSSLFASGDAVLYDTAFKAAGEITVPDGISRYFYYGKDVMGDVSKFNISHAQNAMAYMYSTIDFTNMTNGAKMSNSIVLTPGDKGPFTAIKQYNINKNSGDTRINATIPAYYNYTSDSGAINATNSNYYMWALCAYSGAIGDLPTATAATATAQMQNGWLYLKSAENTADTAYYVSLFNRFTTEADAFYDEDGKLTVSVSLAVTVANYKNTEIIGGFVDCQSNTSNYFGGVFGKKSVPQEELFRVSGGKVYLGETSDEAIVSLKQVGGKWMSSDPVTIHLVFDKNNSTVTAYNSLNGNVVTKSLTLSNSFLTCTDTIFNLRVSGEAYISRVTISEGDLFN